MQKLLTIIIPIYKTEAYIRKCLSSLINHKYLDCIEVLTIIDGSPDNSIKIAQEFANKYPATFKVIEKENGGHGSAINVGIELAKGKYTRILDSDDWFDEKNFPVFIERLMKEDEDLIMTHTVKEYADKSELFVQKIKEHDRTYKIEDIIDKITDTSFIMSRCTYKTKRLKEYGLKLLEKQSYEDTFLHIFPLVFLKSFACYDLVIYHYFLDRPDQSVHQQITMKHCTSWKNVIDQMCAFYLKYKEHFAPKARLYILDTIRKISDNQYVTINNLPYFEAKREIAKYHKEIKSQPIYNEIKGYKGTYYKYTPYFIFRTSKLVYNWIYKLKRLQCSKS